MTVLHVYADESCTTAHRFIVFGAIAVEARSLVAVDAALTAARARARLGRELKWTKVSKAMHAGYRAILDEYFSLSLADTLHFHSMFVDSSTIRHGTYSGGDDEMGFNKLIYQLLLHRIGRRYGDHYDIEVYLDERTHRRDPNEMTAMLNADLAKRWGIPRKPFQSVKFKASHDSDLLQICDVLIGAIGYRKNMMHRAVGAAAHKCDLASHIGRSAVRVERHGLESARAHRFTLWAFRYST